MTAIVTATPSHLDTWKSVVYNIMRTEMGTCPVKDVAYELDRHVPEDVRKKHKNCERRFYLIKAALRSLMKEGVLTIEDGHYELTGIAYQPPEPEPLPTRRRETRLKQPPLGGSEHRDGRRSPRCFTPAFG